MLRESTKPRSTLAFAIHCIGCCKGQGEGWGSGSDPRPSLGTILPGTSTSQPSQEPSRTLSCVVGIQSRALGANSANRLILSYSQGAQKVPSLPWGTCSLGSCVLGKRRKPRYESSSPQDKRKRRSEDLSDAATAVVAAGHSAFLLLLLAWRVFPESWDSPAVSDIWKSVPSLN